MLRYTKILLILLIGGCIYGSSISSLGYRSRTNIDETTSRRRSGNIERTVSGEGYGVTEKGLVNQRDSRPTSKGSKKHLDSRFINRPSNRVDSRSNYQYFVVTAYTVNDSGMNGRGITASGKKATLHRTIAASRGYSFGTKIFFPSLGRVYVVEDRGGMIRHNHIDLLVNDRKTALKWGKRKLKGVVVK